eukprot:3201944-Prymnesium_polylepis.2
MKGVSGWVVGGLGSDSATRATVRPNVTLFCAHCVKGTDVLVRNTGNPSRRRAFAPIASAP